MTIQKEFTPGQPPKNGNLYLLLVEVNDDNDPTEYDEDNLFRTLGFNSGDDNGEDFWHIVGWNHCAEEFTETTGSIIGWAEIPDKTIRTIPESYV